MTKFDIYQEVTDRIIQQLQQGIIPWHKPWKMSGLSIKGETDIGTVIHRQLNDEVCGFMIAKEKSTGKIIEKDFLTGKKYLTVTVRFGHRDIRYLETNAEQWRLDSYAICNE